MVTPMNLNHNNISVKKDIKCFETTFRLNALKKGIIVRLGNFWITYLEAFRWSPNVSIMTSDTGFGNALRGHQLVIDIILPAHDYLLFDLNFQNAQMKLNFFWSFYCYFFLLISSLVVNVAQQKTISFLFDIVVLPKIKRNIYINYL